MAGGRVRTGVGAALRSVPAGVEAALYGLRVEDSDAYGAAVRLSVSTHIGLVSLHGLGPWNRAGPVAAVGRGGRPAAAALAAAGGWAVRGRQVTTSGSKGDTIRNLVCSMPGGDADEFQVPAPT